MDQFLYILLLHLVHIRWQILSKMLLAGSMYSEELFILALSPMVGIRLVIWHVDFLAHYLTLSHTNHNHVVGLFKSSDSWSKLAIC